MSLALRPQDIHLVFNSDEQICKVFDGLGHQMLSMPMRDVAVNNSSFGHFGRCPRGTFAVGLPIYKHKVPFGEWFTPLEDIPGEGEMAIFNRQGIGIHGGGTGLPEPFAPYQGWQVTEGCLRVQNIDNEHFVALRQRCHASGGKAFITVVGS